MAKKTISLKEETQRLYDEHYEVLMREAADRGEAFTHDHYIAYLLSKSMTSQAESVKDQKQIEILCQRLADAEDEMTHLKDYQSRIEDYQIEKQVTLTESLGNLLVILGDTDGKTMEHQRDTDSNPMDYHWETIGKLMGSLKESIGKTIASIKDGEVSPPVAENQLVLTIPEPTLSILTEVTRRLSIQLKKEITPADVLLDGFVKYNVEQYQEWFYPFTIKENEFYQLCGYSHTNLLKWLRGE